MKKVISGIFLLTLLTAACTNNKGKIDPFASITRLVDSVSHHTDSVMSIDPEMRPMQADNSFEDFIYEFTSDREFQLKRIVFPLTVYNEDKPMHVDKATWKHDELFTKLSFYSLIFDSEEEMEKEGDISLKSVKVEFYYPKNHMQKRYYFERVKGIWLLEAIHDHTMERVGKEEDFLDFYEQFVTDSSFQEQRVVDPLPFIAPDPDDEFSIIESNIDAEQWAAFRPELSPEYITNINYGQANRQTSNTKILFLKGNGNGFLNVLHFERKQGEWKLVKFEDTGN